MCRCATMYTMLWMAFFPPLSHCGCICAALFATVHWPGTAPHAALFVTVRDGALVRDIALGVTVRWAGTAPDRAAYRKHGSRPPWAFSLSSQTVCVRSLHVVRAAR